MGDGLLDTASQVEFAVTAKLEGMQSPLLDIVADARKLNNRVVLVVGGSSSSRAHQLRIAADALGVQVTNLGVAYSRHLVAVPRHRRPLDAGHALRSATTCVASLEQPLFLDRLEVLFERSLRIDPLDALRRLGHARTVVAAWPGACRDGRLIYAAPGHPEHCDYPTAGVMIHEIH